MAVKKRVPWRGSFPTIVTPFTTDGDIDEELLRANLRMSLQEGVHGVVMCAHTGEIHLMNEGERERVISIGVEEVAGRVPVIAGTGAINTRDVIRMSKAAKAAGADGAVIEPPYFMQPKQPDLIAHFSHIADAVDIPIMLYNIPPRAGVEIELDTVAKLLEVANIRAIKDSTRNFERIMRLIQRIRGRIQIFIGPARLYGFAGVVMGASGYVDGLQQVVGRPAVELFELAAAGDVARGVPLQHRLFAVGDALFNSAGTFPATIKDAMRYLGRPGGYPRPPLRPMKGEDLRRFQRVLGSLGLVPRSLSRKK